MMLPKSNASKSEPLVISRTPPKHATTLDHTQAVFNTSCHSHHAVALQRPDQLRCRVNVVAPSKRAVVSLSK